MNSVHASHSRSQRLSTSGQSFFDDIVKNYPVDEKYQEFSALVTGKITLDKAKAFVGKDVSKAYRKEMKTRQRFHPTFNPYGLVAPEGRFDRITGTLAIRLMERGQQQTKPPRVPVSKKPAPPKIKTLNKNKGLRNKYKTLQEKYATLQFETLRRQAEFDLRMEIILKERHIRETLYTHAIAELESKIAGFTNPQ